MNDLTELVADPSYSPPRQWITPEELDILQPQREKVRSGPSDTYFIRVMIIVLVGLRQPVSRQHNESHRAVFFSRPGSRERERRAAPPPQGTLSPACRSNPAKPIQSYFHPT
jgi:hypothetical protein